MIKTAPRITEVSKAWYTAHFPSLNAGLEYVLQTFPMLCEQSRRDILNKFSDAELDEMRFQLNGRRKPTTQMAGPYLKYRMRDSSAYQKLANLTNMELHILEIIVNKE